ncbi:Xaa-Pro aminopeptidase 2 [Heterocephalus glaber]|uniref:Xaa-Pro aminopeptidase 2 n=1 Tax=Heterocephalus glaber TaxID=10181 RepID=G5AU68_HETGA|nr:Xaa-Pro aminopeptidase 2 [Heterocephalus glaber]
MGYNLNCSLGAALPGLAWALVSVFLPPLGSAAKLASEALGAVTSSFQATDFARPQLQLRVAWAASENAPRSLHGLHFVACGLAESPLGHVVIGRSGGGARKREREQLSRTAPLLARTHCEAPARTREGTPWWPHDKGFAALQTTDNPQLLPHLPVTAVNTTARLSALRQQIEAWNLSAYIIPDTDAHKSEYIGKHDERRAWITGFKGTAGTAVVTMRKAAVWTDSRYWTQAEREMDCNWDLHKEDSWNSYDMNLQGSNIQLVSITTNLVDLVWGSERPLVPSEPIYALETAFTGSTWQEKVSNIRSQMQKHSKAPTAVLLTALDETAWLFNLRSSDIPYNPFFYSYTLLMDCSIRLFVNRSRFSPETLQYLNSGCTEPMCVQLEDYSQVRDSVQAYVSGDVRVWIGTQYTMYGLYEVIPEEKLVADTYSPVMITKAVKNSKEQALLKASHVRDAVAVIRYLVWLEKNVPKGTVDEFSGAEFMDQLRGKEDFFSGPSFQTISASGLNAALAHYRDGTTDITRTVHWGTPSAFQKTFLLRFVSGLVLGRKEEEGHPKWRNTAQAKSQCGKELEVFRKPQGLEAYTRVLMGNIDLSKLIFPAATSGRVLEAFARKALWDVGLNYGHGTGHGIGNFLCVHEWPVGFQTINIAMAKGMFTSIEPGYYHDGEFGIRIEDVALVVGAKTKYPGSYLTFEVVSFVPYDRNLIDVSLLSPEQLQHLNQYYQVIREKVGPELHRRQLLEEFEWLQRHTEPLSARAPHTASWASVLVASTLAILSWSS